jgi:hypothetical protein
MTPVETAPVVPAWTRTWRTPELPKAVSSRPEAGLASTIFMRVILPEVVHSEDGEPGKRFGGR